MQKAKTVNELIKLLEDISIHQGDLPLLVSGTDSGGYDTVWKDEAEVLVKNGFATIEGVGTDMNEDGTSQEDS